MTFPNEFNRINFKYPEKKDFISIIIPVYKDAIGLKDTLMSLARQKTNRQYEIIIGNDGDDPKIKNICIQFKVKHISTSSNKGSYTLRNMAIEETQGEFLAFTDADIKVSKNWINTGIDELKKGRVYIGGPIYIDKNKLNTLTNYFVTFVEFQVQDTFQRLHFFSTANLFVKRKVIEYVGGFDRRLYSAGDYEFGDRVNKHTTFKQCYSEKLIVVHPPRSFTQYMKKLKRISIGESDIYMLFPERFPTLKRSPLKYLKEKYIVSRLDLSNYSLPMKIQLQLLSYWFGVVKWYYGVFTRSKLRRTSSS